jgi:hypothetical protein
VIHPRTPFALVAASVAVLTVSACGGGKPSDPGPNPSATPTPTTTTTRPAAPSPTPTPIASAASCNGPAPTGSLNNCAYRPDGQLRKQVELMFEEVRNQKDLFYPNSPHVRYMDKMRAAVLASLDRQGICAIWDYGDGASGIGDIIYVRTSDNRVNEAYDIISGNGQLRIGYQNTCEPASIQPAFQANIPVRDPSCTMPASFTTYCLGREIESLYEVDVRNAVLEVIQQRPELFDLKDTLNSELSFRLYDPHAYVAAVIARVRAKGYCAYEDGELAVKKENTMSEQFDIVRTPGDREYQYSLFQYKGRCHNAIF